MQGSGGVCVSMVFIQMTTEIEPTPHPHAKLIMLYATELAAGRIKHWKVEYKSSGSGCVRYEISTNPAWHEDAEYKLTMRPTHPDYKPPVVKQVFNGQEFELKVCIGRTTYTNEVPLVFESYDEARRFMDAIK